ncbi:MAG: AAA family ATPase, partial [Gordonia sp. (in: high G+C Gram-positive bacteria)]
MPASTSAFALPAESSAKADPALIGADIAQFTAIADCLTGMINRLSDRLAVLRRELGGGGRRAVDRDMEIHSTENRLRLLRRHRGDLCLGRIILSDSEVRYIGRIGLVDDEGRQLLVDWRTPAAEPFFAA